MVQDDATQYYYYWNLVTNEVTWEIPPGYTQFLLLYKEYEERIAKIPKDKLQRMKERKERKKWVYVLCWSSVCVCMCVRLCVCVRTCVIEEHIAKIPKDTICTVSRKLKEKKKWMLSIILYNWCYLFLCVCAHKWVCGCVEGTGGLNFNWVITNFPQFGINLQFGICASCNCFWHSCTLMQPCILCPPHLPPLLYTFCYSSSCSLYPAVVIDNCVMNFKWYSCATKAA